jgi:polysaccharide pyruvyl transferase WcaK-like protein
MKTISILATTFSGNKGAAAMLQSVVKNLGSSYSYNLLSVYPAEDCQQNPYPNLKVVDCKPEKIIFVAFPLAILYYLLKWISPIRHLLLKNPILKAFHEADLVLDVAGITFVDSRGFIMNTYNFICVATPLLLGKKVIKYSQALGPFNNFWNRLWAKLVLPRMEKICARGEITFRHLSELNLKNVELCADGAFIMPDDSVATQNIQTLVADDILFKARPIVSISLSSVVWKYCDKVGISYENIMAKFIDHLIDNKGYGVVIIANAARDGKKGHKNNDLHVCSHVYNLVKNKEFCRWYHKEFTPEEIRELISLSKLMVASRFHAMIGALYKEVPVLLIGWSHKYKEVLDMFELGRNATDYKTLNLEDLLSEFERFESEAEEIKTKICSHLQKVKDSSMKNITCIRDFFVAN